MIGPAWDRPGEAGNGLFHQANGRGLANPRPPRGTARHTARGGAYRRQLSAPPPRSTCATPASTVAARPRRSRTTRSVIETHLLPAFGDMRVEDITAAMIER